MHRVTKQKNGENVKEGGCQQVGQRQYSNILTTMMWVGLTFTQCSILNTVLVI